MYKLKNWSLGIHPVDVYRAPEDQPVCVQGVVVEHTKFPVGHRVITNKIVEHKGNVVQTASGSTYELLGEPNPDWVKWLDEQGKEPDPHNITLVRKKVEVV